MQTVMVKPWSDPILDVLGHDPRSWYVETFWPLSNARRVLVSRRLLGLDERTARPNDRATSADRRTVDAPTREDRPRRYPILDLRCLEMRSTK